MPTVQDITVRPKPTSPIERNSRQIQTIPVKPMPIFFSKPSQASQFTYSITNYFSQAKPFFLHSRPFQSGQKQLPPFQPGQNRLPICQAIPVKLNTTSPVPSMPGQTRLSLFQAIAVSLKPTSANPIHSSQPKSDFPRSKPFQSGQNQPPSFQNIPARPKTTSSIPAGTQPASTVSSHSSHAKTNFPHSKPFQPGQTRLRLFQAIAGSLKPTSANPCHFKEAKTNFV
jgi:hypothetical protein